MKYIYIIIIIVFIVLFYLANFSKNTQVIYVKKRIKKNFSINTLLLTTCLFGILSAFFAWQNILISNRDTSPLLHFVKESGKNENYYLENDKGVVSYVTINKNLTFNFIYENEPYQIRVAVSNQNDSVEKGCKNKWYYKPTVLGLNTEDSIGFIKDTLKDKTGEDLIVSGTVDFEVSFFDYKNDKFNFIYTEYDNNITLTSTEGYMHYPEKNITTFLWSEENIESTIESLIDSILIENSAY
ncbi:hypothetical protein LIZ64_05330 [[Clostridium] hylemonae]|uniref:hypothetical protein n=1 Tax=[Clostridium] hylemonae TaxID=89153 RepID=UPI001D05D8E3|nr:hypothetical protein [[Clostridium] hylemonae]MCB7521156.1 hypothetical protein [[Clostridium] hylemonae]